jgi:adenylate kinase family enzyme
MARTVAQAKALEKIMAEDAVGLTAVLNYELPLERVVARISGRRTCAHCHAVYHLATLPPKSAEVGARPLNVSRFAATARRWACPKSGSRRWRF